MSTFKDNDAQLNELGNDPGQVGPDSGGQSGDTQGLSPIADAAEESEIPRPPRDREAATAQLERLVLAHEIVLSFARQAARRASEQGDDGTNDLLVSDLIQLNEKQAWFISEHLTSIKGE